MAAERRRQREKKEEIKLENILEELACRAGGKEAVFFCFFFVFF